MLDILPVWPAEFNILKSRQIPGAKSQGRKAGPELFDKLGMKD
jgi:hypothetical protein